MQAAKVNKKAALTAITPAMRARLPRPNIVEMTSVPTNRQNTFLKSMSRSSRIFPFWPNLSARLKITTKL